MYKSSQTCNFIHVHFYSTFSFATDLKSASNSAFFGTQIENIWKKYFLGHISTFFQSFKPNAHETVQKPKNVFYNCVTIIFFYPSMGPDFKFSQKKSESL